MLDRPAIDVPLPCKLTPHEIMHAVLTAFRVSVDYKSYIDAGGDPR
jgi:hypothetical protein